MIKHIVAFKLKGSSELKKEKAESFRVALLALPNQIDCLLSMEVGINCNSEETWDLVLTAIVENFDDLVKYSCHPKHLEAVDIIKDYKEARACVDYVI